MTGKVVLYTTTHCARCESVKRLLADHAVPFDEISVLRVPGATAELVRLTGALAAPVLIVGRHFLRGYQRDAILALLRDEGWIHSGTC